MPQSHVTDEPRAREAADARGSAPGQQPDADAWLDEAEPLPRRPRRRLLTPLPLALLAALAIACGFIAGALVEKGQGGGTGASSTGGGFASRLAALGGGSGARSGSAAGALGTAGARAAGSSGSATVGQVAYVSGHTLYVTTAEGDTVKVTASAAASISRTVNASVASIHPGETVLVTGARAASGAISAEAIRVGGSAAGGLGGGALFGGSTSGASSRSSRSRQSGGAAGGGEPALFGSGG